MHRTRSVVLATGILAMGISSFAVAQSSPQAESSRTGSNLREGVRNGTSTKETEIVGNLAGGTGKKGGYVTRQSNKSTTGGAAIYGCRATNAATALPCLRANNLSSGKAFEFNATSALIGGTISVGAGGDTKKPFTTNATGVADGLNADRVDGKNAADIITEARAKTSLDADTVDGLGSTQLKTRWALVNEAGEIEAQSGGFTVLDPYVSNQNIYIDAGEDLTAKAVVASLAIRNLDPQEDGNGFGGEISASRCQIPNVVECFPANSKNVNAFVVSPRDSDGTSTGPVSSTNPTATPRKRFYVTIAG